MPDVEKAPEAGDRLPIAEFSLHEMSAVRLLLEFKLAYSRLAGNGEEWPVGYDATINDLIFCIEVVATGGLANLFDICQLAASYWSATDPRRKPRISVSLDLVDGDDLSMTWHDTHFDLNRRRVLPSNWLEQTGLRMKPVGRPSNELLFIRNVGKLRNISRTKGVVDSWIATSVLAILNAAINTRVWQLEACFDTQWLNRIKFKVGKAGELGLSEVVETLGGENDIATGFELIDLIDEERRHLTRFVGKFRDDYKIGAEEFWLLVEEALYSQDDLAFDRVAARVNYKCDSNMEPSEIRANAVRLQRAMEANIWKVDSNVVRLNRN